MFQKERKKENFWTAKIRKEPEPSAMDKTVIKDLLQRLSWGLNEIMQLNRIQVPHVTMHIKCEWLLQASGWKIPEQINSIEKAVYVSPVTSLTTCGRQSNAPFTSTVNALIPRIWIRILDLKFYSLTKYSQAWI